jgi:toxin-antitoxin system PIN domain toxin
VILCDVNVLVYAYRADAKGHGDFRAWLEAALAGDEPFGVSSLIFSGFLRVVTHRKVFAEPSPLEHALRFIDEVREAANAVPAEPGARHWEIFVRLCRAAAVKGNLVPDAYLAAIALEHGATWITTDRDFARFPGLRWRHPLSKPA